LKSLASRGVQYTWHEIKSTRIATSIWWQKTEVILEVIGYEEKKTYSIDHCFD
jgi:hypothetical protein